MSWESSLADRRASAKALWQGGSRNVKKHKEGCMPGACKGVGHERRGLQGQREESGFYSECSEEPPEGLRED